MQETRSFYASRVFPWINDKLASDPALETIRADLVKGARGRVIEIGFGTGLNLPHYPAAVQAVVGIEPNPGMHDRAAPRIRAARVPVDVVCARAESLPLPAGGFDSAVSVLTLCTVLEPARTLAELRRVLRDDGRLFVMEHGLSQDAGVARWQHRLDRVQQVVACGCHLNRSIADLVRDHGFRFETLRQFYVPKMPRTHGWLTVGAAVKA